MIEQLAADGDCSETNLLIRPHRALNHRQVFAAFALVATASFAVAGFSWTQGNVFAPFFAVAELSVLALCLRLVWLAGDRVEVIAVSSTEVSLRCLPDLNNRFREHPSAVKISERDGHVLLVSRGREVEVGACLGEAERESLAKRLRTMIDAVINGRVSVPSRAS